jgi:uncharacterized membrane protein YfcA
LLSLAPETIKPTALALNILVASVTALQFWRAGHLRWRLFWPFALPAVPMAYLGGSLALPARAFSVLLGLVLLYSAWRFIAEPAAAGETRPLRRPVALASGAGIGLLSGLTGTGGGIFLTPLLLVMGWAQPKHAAAVSALFILMNSASGLAGNFASTRQLPAEIGVLLLVVLVGGLAGSWLGARRLPAQGIKRLLAVVLVVAGLKLLLT